MVIAKAASLAVEACLGGASLACFGAVLAGGPRVAALARTVALGGAALAVVAALVTAGADEVWFFDALRVDRSTQLAKAVIAAVLLVALVRARRSDATSQGRVVDLFFRLGAGSALAVAVSAGDMIVLWIALDIASAATIIAVATAGSWSAREPAIRRLVGAWLPMSLLLLLGAVILAAAGGSTSYGDLEASLPDLLGEPAVVAGLVLVGGSIVARATRFAVILLRLD